MVPWATISLYLTVLQYEVASAKEMRKFVYQKDVSEHCRRQVVPSVFLGQHVVEANSQILHFSRLELPYSCFISIRAEAGSNIILFIQLLSQKSLASSCDQHGNQLLVYEMGETYGGYWGPLPPTVLEQKPTKSPKLYTLKTTEPTTASTTPSTEEETTADTETTQSNMTVEYKGDEGNYIRVEIPIVNVSGRLVGGDNISQQAPHAEDSYFDIVYDVLPGRDATYTTSILPLVQFSVKKQEDSRRFDAALPRLYDLSYDLGAFTPDERLRYPTIKLTSTKKKNYKSRYSATKRLYFDKTKLFSARRTTKKLRQSSNKFSVSYKSTTRQTEYIRKPDIFSDNNSSWDFIHAYLEAISNDTRYHPRQESDLSLNASTLMQNIANMEHNTSVYLAPNLSIYDDLPNSRLATTASQKSTSRTNQYQREDLTSNVIRNHSMERVEVSEMQTNMLHKMGNLTYSTTEGILKQPDNDSVTNTNADTTYNNSVVTTDHDNLDNLKVSPLSSAPNPDNLNTHQETILHNDVTIKKRYDNIKTTSTVDHESWENVVQAAHAIAILLNQTVDSITTDTTTEFTLKHDGTNNSREKRNIHPIPIEDAIPHTMITRKYTSETTKTAFKLSDLQNFAELVEISDDEMHGHVILRNPRQYMGPVMFNICDYTELSDRQVFLFNSSHIIMVLNNFTIDRMTLVVTPAHTLLTTNGQCSPAHLECQVSGARVCINTMCACDGIPNCGSFDIYDEDRLMCGAGLGMQHNVCLAAFTFMAVVLTLLYTVHYWLKRCVPKVSQAFFIYTNGGENELYLEPIMRSPYDMDAGPYKSVSPYPDHLFDDDLPYMDSNDTESKPKSIFARIFQIFHFSKGDKAPEGRLQSVSDPEYIIKSKEARKMYSFAEFEIRNNILKQSTDAAIQTGDSLEMAYMDKMQNLNTLKRLNEEKLRKVNRTPVSVQDTPISSLELYPDKAHNQKKSDELNIIKFFKEQIRSDSTGSVSEDFAKVSLEGSYKSSGSNDNEREIKSHVYDSDQPIPGSSKRILDEMSSYTAEPSQVRKQLRFDEDATTIPALDQESDNIEYKDKRRSFISGVGKIWRALDLDTIDEDEEGSTSAMKDHRSFWGSNKKGKKTKKKVTTLR